MLRRIVRATHIVRGPTSTCSSSGRRARRRSMSRAGGGNLARRLGEAGFTRRHRRSVAGDAGRRDCSRRGSPVRRRELRHGRHAHRAAPLRGRCGGHARAGARRAATRPRRGHCATGTRPVEQAEQLRDPTHVRSYAEDEWRGLLEQAGLDVEAVALFDVEIELEPGSPARGARATRQTQVRELLADRIRDGRLEVPRIALKGRK